MSALSKYVSKCGVIAPVLLNISLVMAQSVPTASPDPAAGYYAGTFSNGASNFVTILETGEFFFSTRADPLNSLEIVRGVGQGSNGTFTSNDAVLLGAGPRTPVSVSAVYSPGIGMDISLSESANSTPLNFSVTYDSRYELAYPISAIAGHYNAVLEAGNATSSMEMDVSADGALTATLSSCTLSGVATQLSPTKNPYQVSIAFNGAHCDFGEQPATGVMSVAESTTQPGTFNIGILGTDVNREKTLFIFLSKDPVSIPAPPPPGSSSDSPLPQLPLPGDILNSPFSTTQPPPASGSGTPIGNGSDSILR